MPPLHGHSLVAGRRSAEGGDWFNAVSPIDSRPLPGDFRVATAAEIDAAMAAAHAAAAAFRASDGGTRAAFLEAIATGLTDLGGPLIERTHLETGLATERLRAELDRTVGHLRMFAAIAREHSWHDPRIETADPGRRPLPKPDLRRLLLPIGPVVVFGASNFPLAYSVAGGDTASALATGNPVVVKAHEAHPGASEWVGEAIAAAARQAGLPGGVFSLLQGPGTRLGGPLARHPHTRAIGFTGSITAGRALFDAAASRPDPIPVFAEMGSLNPIVVLPSALAHADDSARTAERIGRSIVGGGGQFCTKPGIILLPDESAAEPFRRRLADLVTATAPATLLHAGISRGFEEGIRNIAAGTAATLTARSAGTGIGATGDCRAAATLVEVTASGFLAEEPLRHEVFGPFAVMVRYASADEIPPILRALGGQLTASVFGTTDEIRSNRLLELLPEIAGRVIVNGVPTGVEVGSAMQHGGPWPASSDSRFTAVGSAALLRFVRPVAFQNVPDSLLPPALQNANPLKIMRLIDGRPSAGSL
jgi:NADP-dependent aldehyde dehydrogenase